jgi:hypothetical protein
MLKYNKNTDNAKITYIDFGVSSELKKDYLIEELYDLIYSGTDGYKPLEMLIIKNMIYYLKKNRYYESKTFSKDVINKTYTEFKDISDEYFYDYHFIENGFKYLNNKIQKNISDSIPKYGNKKIITNIFEYLYRDYKNNNLTEKIINSPKYILKWDIFSLGMVFAELIISLDINDDKAFSLVNKMITPYYWDRYDINQCLNDPIFISKKKTKKKQTIK